MHGRTLLLLVALAAGGAHAWRPGSHCKLDNYCCVDPEAFCLGNIVMACAPGTRCETQPEHVRADISPCVTDSSDGPGPAPCHEHDDDECWKRWDEEKHKHWEEMEEVTAAGDEEHPMEEMEHPPEDEEEVVAYEEEMEHPAEWEEAEHPEEEEWKDEEMDHHHHHHHRHHHKKWKQGERCREHNYDCLDHHFFCLGHQAMRCADGTVCRTQPKGKDVSPCVWP